MERQGRPDGTRVPLDEWATVVAELRRFCDHGEFTESEDATACEFANASVRVTRDGAVEAGMPLHAFECGAAAVLVFDHDHGELTVETDPGGGGVTYTFRRP